MWVSLDLTATGMDIAQGSAAPLKPCFHYSMLSLMPWASDFTASIWVIRDSLTGTPTDTTLYIHMRKTVTLLYTWDWQLWHVHGFFLFHFKLGLNDFGKQSNYIKIYIIYILIIIKIIIVYFRTLNRANSRNTNNFCGIYLPSVFHSDNLFYFKSKHKYT